MPPDLTAATITVRATLDLLDGPFAALAAGVAEDRYAFWLGSGISFGRVDGLRQIVPRVVEFLRCQIAPGVPTCRFQKALTDTLRLAPLTPEEWGRVDLQLPFSQWPDADSITSRLVANYSRVLDVTVDGEADDYLLWHGVNIAATFADPTIPPDVEHYCIAILTLEGAASDVATANWDGLIERAFSILTDAPSAVAIYVRQEDLRQAAHKGRLFKFHGCAVLAVSDEAGYRQFLIARQSQINGWSARPEHAAIVNRLVDIIVSKPTLMMGLSAQDANIQALFAKAEATMPWPWPGDRPSYVFSEDRVGADQEGLLKNVYRAAYSPASRQDVLAGSLIKAYAKPLLVALVLHVLCAKLQHLVALAPGVLPAADREQLKSGHLALRNAIAEGAEPDRLAFINALINHGSRAISVFRDGEATDQPRRYNSLTSAPLQQLAGDNALPASGLREAAVAAGILGIGLRDGLWTIATADPNSRFAGVALVSTTRGIARLFLVANSHTALRLRQNGCLVTEDDAVVVYSSDIVPPMARSPRTAPGRTGHLGSREVSISALLAEVSTYQELVQRFREAVAI